MNPQLSVILFSFNTSLPYIIAIVLLLKIVLFYKFKTNDWKWSNLVYFNYKQILTVKSAERPNIKIIENSLTYYLVFLILINFSLWFYLSN